MLPDQLKSVYMGSWLDVACKKVVAIEILMWDPDAVSISRNHLSLGVIMNMTRTFLAATGVLLLVSCGGGGSSPSPAPQPLPSLEVSTNSITQESALSDPGPMATLQLTLSGSYSGQLYLNVEYTDHGVDSVDSGGIVGDAMNMEIYFNVPSLLGVGTYTDQVAFYASTDEAGSNPLPNSPRIVNTSITVDPDAVITSLDPAYMREGDSFSGLTVTGTGFTPQSQVQWYGYSHPTTYLSPTQLFVSGDGTLSQPGVSISVWDGVQGGSVSNALYFEIFNSAALISSISPTNTLAGGSGFFLDVFGGEFQATTQVLWNGSPRPTTFLGPDHLQAQISPDDIAVAGDYAIGTLNGVGGDAGVNPLFMVMASSVKPAAAALVADKVDRGATRRQLLGTIDHAPDGRLVFLPASPRK